jgi:hypothetical protein
MPITNEVLDQILTLFETFLLSFSELIIKIKF